MRGYIIEEHTWINFKSLSALSEEGGIFDKNTNKVKKYIGKLLGKYNNYHPCFSYFFFK